MKEIIRELVLLKTDAVFWGIDIPVVGTTYISTIMAKYEIQGDRFCLEQIIN